MSTGGNYVGHLCPFSHTGLLGVFSDVIRSSDALASFHRAKMAGIIGICSMRKRTKSEEQRVSLSIYIYIFPRSNRTSSRREKQRERARSRVNPCCHPVIAR